MSNSISVFPWVPLLILVVFGSGYLVGFVFSLGRSREEKQKSLNTQRNVIKGKISEQIAPFLESFPRDLNISEARFQGQPIDFIVYKGLDNKKIEEVVFVEVKTGNAQLNDTEVSLRDAIENKKVRWVGQRINEV